jgi:hypothetical protein
MIGYFDPQPNPFQPVKTTNSLDVFASRRDELAAALSRPDKPEEPEELAPAPANIVPLARPE